MPDPDLAALLAAVASGDRAALRRVYEAQSVRLFGVANAILRDRDAAAAQLAQRPPALRDGRVPQQVGEEAGDEAAAAVAEELARASGRAPGARAGRLAGDPADDGLDVALGERRADVDPVEHVEAAAARPGQSRKSDSRSSTRPASTISASATPSTERSITAGASGVDSETTRTVTLSICTTVRSPTTS